MSTFEELQDQLNILQEQKDLIKINQTMRNIKARQAAVAPTAGTQHRPYHLEDDPEPGFKVPGLKSESVVPEAEQRIADTIQSDAALPGDSLSPPGRGDGASIPKDKLRRVRRRQPVAARSRHHLVRNHSEENEKALSKSKKVKITDRKDRSKRSRSSRLGPVNNDPAYASIVRNHDGKYVELQCPFCHGNASVKSSNVKTDFFRGAPGVRNHVLQCHNDQAGNSFSDDKVLEQGIRRQLSEKEMKAVDTKSHNDYQILVTIAAKKPRDNQPRAPASEQQMRDGNDTDVVLEHDQIIPDPSVNGGGMMSQNTTLGGPAHPVFSSN